MPGVSASVISATAEGSTVRLTVTGGELNPSTKVLAALGGANFTSALSGTYDTAKAEAVFPASLKKNDRLFFLHPDTLVPLAKPAILE